MALDFKYRIHEVAKDFGMTSKDISQILTDYATTPKNHMQVLEDAELDLIFEYLTQHHQVGSIAEIFAPEPEEKKAPTKVPEEKKAAAPAPAAPAPAAEEPVEETDDDELIAVIAAAVAAAMEQAGEENTTGFVVRSIRRINNAPAWNRAGREEQVYSRM